MWSVSCTYAFMRTLLYSFCFPPPHCKSAPSVDTNSNWLHNSTQSSLEFCYKLKYIIISKAPVFWIKWQHWWESYKCSVTLAATTRALQICIQLDYASSLFLSSPICYISFRFSFSLFCLFRLSCSLFSYFLSLLLSPFQYPTRINAATL